MIEGTLNPAKVQKSPRFDAFAEEYLEWVKSNRKPFTYQQASVVVKTLRATFGAKRLNEVTAWHIEQFKKTRQEAGLAPATINKELAFLKGILNKAVTWKKLTAHPGKEVQALKVTNERTRFLSEEEAAQLAVCSPALRRIVEAGLLTGFRRQELVNLRTQDINFDRRTVSVAACYSKNGESRTIPMGERLRAVVQEALSVRGDTPVTQVPENSTFCGSPSMKSSLTTPSRRTVQIRDGVRASSPSSYWTSESIVSLHCKYLLRDTEPYVSAIPPSRSSQGSVVDPHLCRDRQRYDRRAVAMEWSPE